jgi:hypothetical protein
MIEAHSELCIYVSRLVVQKYTHEMIVDYYGSMVIPLQEREATLTSIDFIHFLAFICVLDAYRLFGGDRTGIHW